MTPQHPSTPAATPPDLDDVLDAMLARIRELTLRIVTDGDESWPELQQTACDLAVLVQDLDTHACLGAVPRAWQPSSRTPPA